MFWAPTIFLPTTLFEYCTGTLLSACCTNTTAATNIMAPTIIPIEINNPCVENSLTIGFSDTIGIIKFQIEVTALGKPATIPTNIIIEIPLPIPLLVISSPSHISKAVPAINDITTVAPVINPLSMNIPIELYDRYNANPSIKARNTVRIFVYLLIFFLPSSPPSLVNLSKAGITMLNNWITIDAVMYGLIDIAKIENLEKAPPEIKSISAAIPFVSPKASLKAKVSTPGTVM